MKNSASKSSISNLLTKLLSFPLTFFTGLILAVVLGPEQRGALSYLLLFQTFSMPIINLGMGTGVTYYLSNKKFNVPETFLTSTTIGVLQGLLGSFVIFLLWKNSILIKEEHIGNFTELLPILILLPINALLFYTERTLIGKSEFIFINYMTLLQPIIYLSGIGLVYYSGSINVTSVLYCILGYNLIRATISFWKVLKEYEIDLTFSKDFLKKISNYGLRGWFGRLALMFNLRIDQFVIGAYSSYYLGIYVIAIQLAEIIWIIPDSLGIVLFNQISAEKDEDKQLKLVSKLHRILFWMVFVVAIIVAIGGYFLIPFVFGEKYEGSTLPFLLVLPGIVMQTSVKILTKLFAGRGKIEYNSMVTFFGMAISVVLYFLTIPKYNIVGAAISSSIGYSSSAILAYVFGKYKFKISLLDFFIPQKDDLQWVKSKILKR